VHNGIEYADMQLIAEAYDLMARGMGMDPPAVAEAFAKYNQGPLESFLVEITAKIFGVPDPDGGHLIDRVLDKAGQKGTGRWTAQVALDLGVPVPSIAAAIDARVLSSMKGERVVAADRLTALRTTSPNLEGGFLDTLEKALEAAKIISYSQGLALIRAGSEEYGWGIDAKEIARIWKGGCIIRARLLDDIMQAHEADPTLVNLMMAETFSARLNAVVPALREVVAAGQVRGIPVHGFASSLAYFDSYRTASLPQNLTQAQRDAFGAHTYKRKDDPEGESVHTDWLG
jgi:6-phosphogluconate dehydrogenase